MVFSLRIMRVYVIADVNAGKIMSRIDENLKYCFQFDCYQDSINAHFLLSYNRVHIYLR